MNVYINNIFYYLPTQDLDNEQLSLSFGSWDQEKIYSKTGIKNRKIAFDNETALDLSFNASVHAINYIDSMGSKIDYLIYISQTNDYLLPGNATLLLHKLGIKNIPSIDVNIACSGYIYALNIAYSLIKAKQANNILIVTSDTYSKIINNMDKSTRTLFGDGSSATIVSNVIFKESLKLEIVDFLLGSDGEKFDSLYIKEGGQKFPFNSNSMKVNIDEKGYSRRPIDLFMDGEEVLKFTISIVPSNIITLLKNNNLELRQIKYYFLHQANKFILDFIGKKLGILDKLIINLENTGNTTSSSIPILYKSTYHSLDFKTGDIILFSGFGVGLSWGSVLLKHH